MAFGQSARWSARSFRSVVVAAVLAKRGRVREVHWEEELQQSEDHEQDENEDEVEEEAQLVQPLDKPVWVLG